MEYNHTKIFYETFHIHKIYKQGPCLEIKKFIAFVILFSI